MIPYYHIVSDAEILHVKYLYKNKTVKQFREDIDFLLKNFSPMGLLEILTFMNADRPLPEKVFLLTFDDGFREIYIIVHTFG
jgi:peptidoglycan/xylan/chitin deacetylase (PgdA/CDA1 family)